MESKENSEKYCYFWGGIFSNFYTSPYEHTYHDLKTGQETKLNFFCAEQGYMWEKSMIFGDEEICEQMLKATNPYKIKKLCKSIKDFNQDTWDIHKERVMFDHCWNKYTQNPSLKKHLLDICGMILVEASATDRVWGIGLNEECARRTPEEEWPGTNLLGKTLMKIRGMIKPLPVLSELPQSKALNQN